MTVPSPSVPRSAAVQFVREKTASRHRQVERRLDVRSSFASVSAYGRMLERLLGFHAPLEAVLRSAPSAVEGVDPLPRAARLEADLVAVGRGPRGVAVHESPLPVPVAGAAGVGALYVIEGSALGGAVLARLAARRLDLTAAHGASFFHGDAGPATEQRWERVLAAIDAEADAGELSAVVMGACQTFDTLDAWLARR